MGAGSIRPPWAFFKADHRKAGPNPCGITPAPRIRLNRATSARLAHAVSITGIPAPELIDTALQQLLSGADSPDRTLEAQNKAAGRAGLGWPPDGSGPAPTVADLLPQDIRERFLEVWLTTGANVLYSQAISLLATLEEGGAEAVARISDCLEADIWERTQALAAKWEGGQEA